MAPKKRLLIVAHAPSANTQRLFDAVVQGARSPEISGVAVAAQSAFVTVPDDVLSSDAVLLGTTENLGYMAGAVKDFFDRIYYPCLELTHGRPFAFWIRAGHDGTGTRRAIETITTGLRWRAVQEPLVCRGGWDEGFIASAGELGLAMAAGLEAGVF
jgi:multimeric flavodoxin WrbA